MWNPARSKKVRDTPMATSLSAPIGSTGSGLPENSLAGESRKSLRAALNGSIHGGAARSGVGRDGTHSDGSEVMPGERVLSSRSEFMPDITPRVSPPALDIT